MEAGHLIYGSLWLSWQVEMNRRFLDPIGKPDMIYKRVAWISQPLQEVLSRAPKCLCPVGWPMADALETSGWRVIRPGPTGILGRSRSISNQDAGRILPPAMPAAI